MKTYIGTHNSRCLQAATDHNHKRGPCIKVSGHDGNCYPAGNKCVCCGRPRAQILRVGPVCIDCPNCNPVSK